MNQKNIIEVKGFKKSFGPRVVHRDVSFNLIEGECLGLIGGSGVGKSVILRSLIGLERADAGEILIFGKSIGHLEEGDLVLLRKQIAYAFQGGALFDSMTVFENLAYPLREHTRSTESEILKKVRGKLAQFGLSDAEQIYPGQLSGGMQKRVGLARAMMLEPQLILYDEPTAGLDPYNTRMIQDLILRLKGTGVSSILVTHDMPTAFAVCDRMAFLLQGKIAALGTIEELKSQKSTIIKKFIDGEEH